MSENEQVNDTTTTGQATGQQADTVRTFTQAELDAIITKRLTDERERQQRRMLEQYGDLDELVKAREKLAELEAAQMSEADKLRKQLEEKERTLQQREAAAREAELTALRLEIGQVKSLPVNLAKRLVGTTREELEADADAVLAELKPAAKPAPNLNAAVGGGGQQATTDLTNEERALCDKHGIPYETYAKNKAKLQ